MKNVFELTPILTAAAIGAAAFWILIPATDTMTTTQKLGFGAVTGAAVQIGVRLIGVS